MFVDIHSHILPQIDDGARNDDVFEKMIHIAEDNGILDVITTPHLIKDTEFFNANLIIETLGRCRDFLAKKGYQINLYQGAEVFISPDIVDLYLQKKVLTLNHSKYMLVELPNGELPIYTENALYELQLVGIIPIIAHPERNSQIIRDLKFVKNLYNRGILFQVNSGSLLNFYGKKIMKAAYKLISEGYIQFVASDCHSANTRAPRLREASDIITKKFGYDAMNQIFCSNGLAVIKDEEI